MSDDLIFTRSLVFTPAEKDAYISLFAENLFKGTSLKCLDRPLLETIKTMLPNLITAFATRLALNTTAEGPILDDTIAFVRGNKRYLPDFVYVTIWHVLIDLPKLAILSLLPNRFCKLHWRP
jgi:hypothetical protein